MSRPGRSPLSLLAFLVCAPVCRSQSKPQQVRDNIYGQDGRLIVTAEPSAYADTLIRVGYMGLM